MEEYKDEKAKNASEKTHPFATSNIFSRIFFTWMISLFIKGFKKDLHEDDLYTHLQSHDSTYLGDKLEKQWFKQVKKKPNNPSLWIAMSRVFGRQFFWLGVFYLCIELFVRLGQPMFLSRLLEYYEPNSTMTKNEAYWYASAIGACSLLSAISVHTFMLHNQHLGMKIRVAASALVYRKALKLSKSALGETSVGQMVNFISNDVGRFETLTTHLHSLWMAPLETVAVLILLYFYVGFTGMVGAVLLFGFIPFQMWMGKKTSQFRLATAIRTDERIRLMNEIISGMQVIKMYTWEKPFAKLVELSRRKEMDQIKKISIIRAIMISFNIFLNRAAVNLCIITYVLTGSILNAQYVYVLKSFYGILRMSVTMHFPIGITQIAEANISIRRIQKFLMHEEINFDSSATFFNAIQSTTDLKPISNGVTKLDEPASIYMKNASVKWLKTRSENTLEDLNINVKSNELVAVIGPVGCGKSTLLHAILGELPPTSGTINVKGRISYASQEPWLFAGSVRQNIIFGQKFDARKYHEVVRICQLQRDFNLFPYKDRTIVGERGVSLSGGQRARINLARAVYKDADIYLLDDPLSAVDAHVGNQLFEECITDHLNDKCVILVTHQLQYLKNVQNIFLLDNGKIDCSGTYEEVQASGGKFTELLHDLKDIIDEDEEDEDKADEEEDIKSTRLRRVSTKEVISKNDDEDPTLLLESRQGGKVTWSVYKSYFVAGGHWCKILTLFITFIAAQAVASLADYFLTWWVNMNQIKQAEAVIIKNNIRDISSLPSLQANFSDHFPIEGQTSNYKLLAVDDKPKFEHTPFQNFWFTYMNQDVLIYSYSFIVIMVITLTIGRSIAFYRFCNKASIRLHNNMFYNIVYATMRFFNVNPSGRILNRFSKDTNQVDEILPSTLLDTLQILLIVVAITTIIATINPWVLPPVLVMLTIFYFMRVVFLSTSRNIKRLEGITRSPVYSHLTASLQGLTTIRAFGAQGILKDEFDNYQNAYSSAYFMFLAANRTFGFWLDMHCSAFIIFITLSFLIFDTESFGGNVGLAITQALHLMGMFQWGMRQWSELENTMTCVERIKEYADVVQEQDMDTKDPPTSWPDEGNIKFDNLSLSYAVGEPCVLKNLNFAVKSSEKVGIVGRTGAGKSSIIIALFRLAITEGRIIIDNVDIGKIPLRKVRSSISIIPQEPVLFSETLRKNLDPFDEHTDEALWNALEEVELKSVVSDLPQGLESKMSEGGSNFSVGQRQLVCLARAIIRKNKILVLDEATANVDPQTDALIQTTIRKKFSNCTVLTIAHRLHTVMDSDKVLVMDAGRVVEFGHAHELLQKTEGGMFYDLVQQTGKAMAENLTSIAQESYKKTTNEYKKLTTKLIRVLDDLMYEKIKENDCLL